MTVAAVGGTLLEGLRLPAVRKPRQANDLGDMFFRCHLGGVAAAADLHQLRPVARPWNHSRWPKNLYGRSFSNRSIEIEAFNFVRIRLLHAGVIRWNGQD